MSGATTPASGNTIDSCSRPHSFKFNAQKPEDEQKEGLSGGRADNSVEQTASSTDETVTSTCCWCCSGQTDSRSIRCQEAAIADLGCRITINGVMVSRLDVPAEHFC